MTYAEKLKDPRWQKKRLLLLESADWTCASCGSKTNTLHVHHCFYERGLNPWKYPDYAYRCLCADCHTIRQDLELTLQKSLCQLSDEDLDILRCDVIYAIVVHGAIKKIAAYCGRMGA